VAVRSPRQTISVARARDIASSGSARTDIARAGARGIALRPHALRPLLLRLPNGLIAAIDAEVARRHEAEKKRYSWSRAPKRVDVVRDLLASALKVSKYDGRPRGDQ
jgi:hypothetical protein